MKLRPDWIVEKIPSIIIIHNPYNTKNFPDEVNPYVFPALARYKIKTKFNSR